MEMTAKQFLEEVYRIHATVKWYSAYSETAHTRASVDDRYHIHD